MSKLGKPYENALSSILRHFDKGTSTVEEGVLLEGPDGSREVDVLIVGTINGESIKFVFECKDYKSRRRIGIETIDAFESKIRDLGATGGAICSNADFSKPARNKAIRKNIGLIAILSRTDAHSYSVKDIFESREIETHGHRYTVVFANDNLSLSEGFVYEPLLDGNSISQLAEFIYQWGIAIHPIVNGNPEFKYKFQEPWEFEFSGLKKMLEITISGTISGAWLRKEVEVESDQGLYDWLLRRVHLPGSTSSVSYKGLAFDHPKYWVRNSMFGEKLLSDDLGFKLITAGFHGFSKSANKLSSRNISRIDTSQIELLNPSERLSTSMRREHYERVYKKRITIGQK